MIKREGRLSRMVTALIMQKRKLVNHILRVKSVDTLTIPIQWYLTLFVIIQPNDFIFNGNDIDDQMLFLRKSKISAALSGPGLECSPLVIVTIRDQRRVAHDVTLHWSPETQKYLVTAWRAPSTLSPDLWRQAQGPGQLSSQPRGERSQVRRHQSRSASAGDNSASDPSDPIIIIIIWSVMRLLTLAACVALAQAQWPQSQVSVSMLRIFAK